MSTHLRLSDDRRSASMAIDWDRPRVAASACWTSTAGAALRCVKATADWAVATELARSTRFPARLADPLRRELLAVAEAAVTELTIEVNYAVPPLGPLLTALPPQASLPLLAPFHCSVAAAALAEDRRRLELSLRVARHVYGFDEAATRRWAAMASNGEASVLAGAWWDFAETLGAGLHDRRARAGFERLYERTKIAARPFFRPSADGADVYD